MTALVPPVPFTLHAAVTETLGEVPFTLEVVGTGADSTQEGMRSAVALFVRAGEFGMFGGLPLASTRPPLVLEELEWDGNLRYTGTATGLSPGAFRVLLNLLIVCHHRAGPLHAVHLMATAALGRTYRGEELLAVPYPGRVSSLAFPVEVDDEVEFVTDPAIRVRFQRPPDEEFEAIKEQIETWDALIVQGGVWNTTLPDEPPFFPVATYRLSSHVIEHTLSGFMAPADVYDLLINMVAKLDQAICPVEALEVF